jgi:hypothetical protein
MCGPSRIKCAARAASNVRPEPHRMCGPSRIECAARAASNVRPEPVSITVPSQSTAFTGRSAAARLVWPSRVHGWTGLPATGLSGTACRVRLGPHGALGTRHSGGASGAAAAGADGQQPACLMNKPLSRQTTRNGSMPWLCMGRHSAAWADAAPFLTRGGPDLTRAGLDLIRSGP